MWIAVVVACAIAAIAIALRVAILFSTAFPPGIDAAYYPLQTRGLLESGKLPYSDLPLMFWLNAAVAKSLMSVGGLNIDDATLLASRLIDAVCQPLCAIPLVLLVGWFAGAVTVRLRESSGGRDRWLFLALAAAAVSAAATLSTPILRMTGDFEKNSLGLVWMAGSAWALHRALRLLAVPMSGGRDRVLCWIPLAGFLGLAALTHIGAFGVTVALAASALGVYAFVAFRMSPRRIGLAALAGIASAALLWLMVFAVAPQKATGLVLGVGKMFTVGDRPLGGPGQGGGLRPEGAGNDARTDRPPDAFRPQRRADAPMGSPPGGPPGGFSGSSLPLRAGMWLGVLALAGLATRRAWVLRQTGLADFAVVCGSAIASTLITCPLLQGQYAERLSLMAPVPLAIPLGYLLVGWSFSPRTWVRVASPAVCVILVVGLIGAALPMGLRGKRLPGGGMGAVVDDGAAPEFRSMRGLVPTDGSSVVVARHGLQWWAGYFLRTPVREEHATPQQLAKYTRVFVLQEKRSNRLGPPGRADRPESAHDIPSDRRIPGGRQDEVRIPDDARIVHDGEYYKLAELPPKGAGLPK